MAPPVFGFLFNPTQDHLPMRARGSFLVCLIIVGAAVIPSTMFAGGECTDLLASLLRLRFRERHSGETIFFAQGNALHTELPFLTEGQSCAGSCIVNSEQIILHALGMPLLDLRAELTDIQ